MRKSLIALCLTLPLALLAGMPQTVVLDVQNMTCPLCSLTIRKALEKVPGVAETKIDYDHKTATVKFDAAKVSTGLLMKAATEAGFPATLHGSKP
jgi:mercuric ion binding protein